MTYSTLVDVSHRLLVEPRSTALQTDEKDILAELRPQAFMFRARNFNFKAPYSEWLDQFTKLLQEIRNCVGHQNLLLSIDHEGGRVVRPPSPITRFPYAACWGERVADVAAAMALELRSLGLNTAWAPVADVLTNRESKAIGQRAFSSKVQLVAEMAVIMARTLMSHGIAAAAKHFPGYGAVKEDAHFDLPTAMISRAEWENVHIPPFVRLIEEGINFIMTAHIHCPELDPNDQATLSKLILSDLLRGKLGFRGVVVADALGMGAIKDEIETAEAVEKALVAELDLFCVAGDSVDLSTARKLAGHILDAVSEDRISEELLETSRKRIQSTINSLPQHLPKVLDAEVFLTHGKLAHELDPNDEWRNFQYIPVGFD